MAVRSISSGPSAHRRCLLQLSRSLERQDINELLYLSEDFILHTEVVLIESGVDLMRCLEKHGRLAPGNYTYLASCLSEIGRIDLVQKLELLTYGINGQLQPSHVLHWKRKAIQDKQKRFLQKKGELQQLSQDTHFWDTWMSDTLQKLSTQLEAGDAQSLPVVKADNTNQALKAAGKLIGGAIQHSGILIAAMERHHDGPPKSSSFHLMERLEEELSIALSSSPLQSTAPSVQVEPIVRLKEKHPLSLVATKIFSSLSDLLREICGEAEAKKQLKEIEESLLAIKSLLHINAHLCFGFLSLVHLTDRVAASESEVLDQEAKMLISSLVHAFPDGAIITVIKPTLEALKGTSVLSALKEDEEMKIFFTTDLPVMPCPCKANKSLRFGLLTVLLTLYKSAKLTRCEWRAIQAQIMQQFRMNLFEPNYYPFLEIDTIVMNSLERLFKHFSKATLPSLDSDLSDLEDQLKQIKLSESMFM